MIHVDITCCVITEVTRVADEVWITHEPFFVAPEGWNFFTILFFSNFSSNGFITLSFLSDWFFKVQNLSWKLNLSEIPDVLMLSVSDCNLIGTISDVSKS